MRKCLYFIRPQPTRFPGIWQASNNAGATRFALAQHRGHERVGTLWAERFNSVIVEDGVAARAMAAYIGLNPVRAGIVTEPTDYRWNIRDLRKGTGRGHRPRHYIRHGNHPSHSYALFARIRWSDILDPCKRPISPQQHRWA